MPSVVLIYGSGRIEVLTVKMGSSLGVLVFSGKKSGHVLFKIRYLIILRSQQFSVKRELCQLYIYGSCQQRDGIYSWRLEIELEITYERKDT